MALSIKKQNNREKIIELTKSPKMTQFSAQKIVQKMSQKDLLKLQRLMKKHKNLAITEYLRIMRSIIHPAPADDFYLTLGLFRMFQEMCLEYGRSVINFDQISSYLTDKMPAVDQQIKLKEKLYPMSIQIPDNVKKKIFAPEVLGKVANQRQKLEQRPYLADKFTHLNRRVGRVEHSAADDVFFTIDYPSLEIKILNKDFQLVRTMKTELDISKRDAIITSMTWSEHQQRLACLLGNYSISLWAKQDNYRYEVNIPLPYEYLSRPYVMIKYMESSKIWFALDNRPSIYTLSSYNFEPIHVFTHFKMIKEKQTEKMIVVELKYRELICIAFERSIFLVSLKKREIVTQLRNFKTSILAVSFSETYQALFVSTFQNYFSCYELSEHSDLTYKGKFEGHKHLVSLIGVLEDRPVVYSLQQDSTMKIWDIRDFKCYQTFSVLKNVSFHQVLALPNEICLVGSKLYKYRWVKDSKYKQKEKVLVVKSFDKNVIFVTNKQIKLYSHSNGILIKVIKAIFEDSDISCAYFIEARKIILLANDEGHICIYSLKDFVNIGQIKTLPKPHSFFYDKEDDILVSCCIGQIQISQYMNNRELDLKRRIYYEKAFIKHSKICPEHDLIAVQYQNDDYLFFYNFQKIKPLGFVKLKDLVQIQFIQAKSMMIFLTKTNLMIFTYKKSHSSLTFFLKMAIDLWQKQEITKNEINFKNKPFDVIISTSFFLFPQKIVVTSNDALFHCIIGIDIYKLKPQGLIVNTAEYYNPYRIITESHNEAFELTKPSFLIDESDNKINSTKNYILHSGNKSFMISSQVGNYYLVTDQNDTIFYDLEGVRKGCINIHQTLPTQWEVNNYDEQELSQLQFVFDYVSNQNEKATDKSKIFSLTESSKSQMLHKNSQVISLSLLQQFSSSDLSNRKIFKSNSLREKKMVLEKQRDERQKYENFVEHRKSQQMLKLKNIYSVTNQKYIGESLAFLNINRNKLIMNRGTPELQMPAIKAFEQKLSSSINKDQKKSIMSKVSHSYEFNSPLKRATQQQVITKAIENTKNTIQTVRQVGAVTESVKVKLKRLDLALFESKNKHKMRSDSLPVLRNSQAFQKI